MATTATRVRTYYLEMISPGELRPPRDGAGEGLAAYRTTVVCPELNRFFYTAVGRAWYWVDRLGWSYADWQSYLDRPELETWVGYIAGDPVGYFELERQGGGDVEIAYFGLLPAFIGRGYGGRLLTRAVERAWEMGATRVWVHTCTLDGPAALANYKARGFRLYREEGTEQHLSPQPPAPWPGAFPETVVGGATGDIRMERVTIDSLEETVRTFTRDVYGGDSEMANTHFADHAAGGGDTFLAFLGDVFAGYVTLRWQSNNPAFRSNNIPLIHHLEVFEPYRRRGVASRLMDAAEALISTRARKAGITVGLSDAYGPAQRLYGKRGYVPDGRGACQGQRPVRHGETVDVDHDFILWLVKELRPDGGDRV